MIFAELDIKVNITELDVDVLPQAWHLQNMHLSDEMHASLNPYAKELSDSVNQALAKRYAELFNVYLKYSHIIERITFPSPGHRIFQYLQENGYTTSYSSYQPILSTPREKSILSLVLHFLNDSVFG